MGIFEGKVMGTHPVATALHSNGWTYVEDWGISGC